jgi:outer membrane immunogenic protein
MKTIRLAVLATIAVAASVGFNVRGAVAADYPIYEIPEITQPSGLYAGLFAGWGWGDSVVSTIDPEVEGFLGGGLIGWELRRDNFLVGVEGDIGVAGIDGVNSAASTEVDVNWLASLRLRAGVDMGGFAFYGTGGVAFANMDAAITTAAPPSDRQTLTGYVLGVGMEAPLTENLAARLEYMYYDFNPSDFMIGGVAVQADLRLHTVRGALVYNFPML